MMYFERLHGRLMHLLAIVHLAGILMSIYNPTGNVNYVANSPIQSLLEIVSSTILVNI